MLNDFATRLRILCHVGLVRPDRIARRSEVTLVEHAQLVWAESTSHAVDHAAVVEEDEVAFAPVCREEVLRV